MRLPAGAWDCHAHIIGDRARYPLAPARSYDPPRAQLGDYLDLLDRCGIERGFLVQPSVYGFDNSCMLDALDRGGGRLLGIAVPAPATTHAQLEALHRRGVRGVRCNLLNAGGLDIATALQW
jgi:predicted TIM-barrel fold metal-dependent hydrolase